MKYSHKFLGFLTFVILIISSCGKKEAELPEAAPAISGVEAEYYVLVRDSIQLSPVVASRVDSIVWVVNGIRTANALKYTFQAPVQPAVYSVIIMAYNSGNVFQKVVQITTGRYRNWETKAHTVLTLEASAKFADKSDVKWEVLSAPSHLYRLLPGTATAQFIAMDRGTYQLLVSSGELADTLMVTVRQPIQAPSPYLSKVFDYLPAPGQFVNELPLYEAGDTYETMVGKVNKQLVGENPVMITLGGWGGYVVVGFDHTIVNVSGKRDFRIQGNAFGAAANPRPNAPFGGSCEPGIVMVAYDRNKNGKPDEDEWYEIKGSGNFSAEGEPWYSAAVNNNSDVRTFHNYEMTYSRPATEAADSTPANSYTRIRNYINWTDNQGQRGYKIKNTFHAQSYYPLWVKDNTITYKGIRLANNAIDESKQGSYYVLYAYRYGYVDNYPNAHDNSGIDIDWAIDKNGNKVHLPGIDFVKVYNGIDQENGWLGEASTEIGRGEDLHLLRADIATVNP